MRVEEEMDAESSQPEAAMHFRPLRKGTETVEKEKPWCDLNALSKRWATRLVELPSKTEPMDLLPEFWDENPGRWLEGQIMLTSLATMRGVLHRRGVASVSRIENLPETDSIPAKVETVDHAPEKVPESKGGVERAKEYFLTLKAQDISPVESDDEPAGETKLKLEDVEEIIDRAQSLNADVRFVPAELIIYADGQFEDGIDEE